MGGLFSSITFPLILQIKVDIIFIVEGSLLAIFKLFYDIYYVLFANLCHKQDSFSFEFQLKNSSLFSNLLNQLKYSSLINFRLLCWIFNSWLFYILLLNHPIYLRGINNYKFHISFCLYNKNFTFLYY
jgi:hypothetical protein